MSLLSAINLAKSYGPRDIFQDASLTIPQRARIGLVGPNGVGKTTLLRILIGLEEPSAGSVQRSRGLRIGYLPQNATLDSNRNLWQECLAVFGELIARQEDLSRLEQSLGSLSEDELETALARYGKLQEEFERQGGYTYETRIRQTLTGLGFSSEDYHRPVWQLSGGQRTRAFLAQLLLSDPDLLLLDEPTNHLDISAIEWLESYMREWRGGVLLISHDRYFLDQVVNTIIEMTPRVSLYHGNYSSYIQQREARWERLQQIYESEKERLLKDLDYVKRNIAGQRTQQAKGRLRRLSRELEAIEQAGFEAVQNKNWAEIAGEVDVAEHPMGVEEAERRLRALRMPGNRPPQLKFHLKTGERSGDLVVRTRNLEVGYADEGRPLFSAPDLTLQRGECAGVIGPNGAGKTTFLKTLLGQIPPYAGEVVLGASLNVGYFAQAHEGLRDERTLMEEIEAVAPHMRPAEIRDYLARFLFEGDEVFKRVGVLSGGERGRVALACLALSSANLLLLDEPSNHLDLPSQEVLQSVLADFAGTILLVSHDRYLIDALSTQIWEVDPEQSSLRIFQGTYSEYRAVLQAEAEVAKLAAAAHTAEPQAVRETQPAVDDGRLRAASRSNNRERQRKQRLAALEQEIHDLESQLNAVSSQLENPANSADRVTKLGQEYERLQRTLEERMEEWGQLFEEVAG